jgi:DNA-binding GntR family transcriptional regulator
MPTSQSSEPLHRQVARLILDKIAVGTWAPGERLPSERTLAEQLSVSRVTVRRALQELSDVKLISSAAGRGSFVTSGPLAEPPNALMGFTELALARGFAPTARVLSQVVRPATLEESEAFGVVPGREMFELRRLRMLDDIPAAIDGSLIPLSYAPALVDADFTTDSLYGVLDASGVGPVRADYAVQATAANPDQAELLGIGPGAPLLVTRTNAFASTGDLVERASTTYPSERYQFRATLIRRPAMSASAAHSQLGRR